MRRRTWAVALPVLDRAARLTGWRWPFAGWAQDAEWRARGYQRCKGQLTGRWQLRGKPCPPSR